MGDTDGVGVLREALDAACSDGGGVVGRRLGQDHPDCERLPVGHTPLGEEPLDQVGRCGRVADLPRTGRPAARRDERADLVDRLADVLRAETEPLHDGEVGVAARAERDHVARVDDALLVRSEWRVGVGVLGELADHGQAARSLSRVSSRCSGITFTSASTGMKFVSPLQRGTTCSWRCPVIEPPATAPRFQPTL